MAHEHACVSIYTTIVCRDKCVYMLSALTPSNDDEVDEERSLGLREEEEACQKHRLSH